MISMTIHTFIYIAGSRKSSSKVLLDLFLKNLLEKMLVGLITALEAALGAIIEADHLFPLSSILDSLHPLLVKVVYLVQ